MKIERTKNAKRNIAFGIVNQVITIVLPFVIRTVTIKTLGAEYLGCSSLFTSILTVLSLTELGFSSAIVYSMYKPIAEDDTETICALLNFYKKVYRIIGIVVFVLGVLVIPFLPKLIHGTYPEGLNLPLLYCIYLVNTAVSYFLFAYYSSLLTAFQRTDVQSNINSILSVIKYIVQVVILLAIKDYYLYVAVLPVITIVSNIITAVTARKLYPQYVCRGNLNAEIKKDIKVKVSGMMITKLQGVSRNTFDSIFISAFLGLTQAAIYSNYYYVISSIIMFLYIITNSITAGVGNAIASESVEKNYHDMNKINFVYMWISSWCTICLLCLYQPFMHLWVGDSMMFGFPVMALFCIYFYSLKIGDIRSVYFEAKGLWWENRYKAICEALSNLVLNFFLGKYFGVYGILAATIITILIINFGYGTQIVFKHYFGMDKIKAYFLRNLSYFLVTAAAAIVTYLVCSLIVCNEYVAFLLKGMVCVIVPNILFLILYKKHPEYSESIPWILRVFKLDRIRPVSLLIKRIENQ